MPRLRRGLPDIWACRGRLWTNYVVCCRIVGLGRRALRCDGETSAAARTSVNADGSTRPGSIRRRPEYAGMEPNSLSRNQDPKFRSCHRRLLTSAIRLGRYSTTAQTSLFLEPAASRPKPSDHSSFQSCFVMEQVLQLKIIRQGSNV
jgi:hypothetical protein